MTWPRGWCADTLSKRLFVLLWVTLVGSDLLGFWLVRPSWEHGPFDKNAPRPGDVSWHVLPPFLPPGPLLGHDPGREHGPDGGHMPGHALPDAVRGQGPDSGPAGPQHNPDGGPAGDRPQPGEPAAMAAPDGVRASASVGPDAGMHHPHHGGPPNRWLDYLARILVLSLAAWLGSRWLTAPMRQLTKASRSLGQSMGRGGELHLLDQDHGPLEVRQTARVFNDMSRGLSAQFEQRSLMMAAVSHDLRTPLTRLRMRLEKLMPDPVAERCVTDVQDINAMIDAVLDAMNEERRQEPVQPVDVLALVQAMADDLQEAGHAVTASGDAATLRVQPVAFKRVLANLISNAVRYGGGAEIRVTVQREPMPGQVRITIDDQGPGIAPEMLETVFKPFTRLDTSRSRETGGVGLGLYIARELTHRHGGTITLSNRPEGGLRAELVLPQN
jgi:signal transduction histidine kinase